MPQQEGETNYKYEDYASEMTINRLPQTAALVNQTMKITLDSGASFDLEFTDRNKLYTIGLQATLAPKSQMLLDITADIATAYVNTRFQLSCEMMYQIEDDF